MKQFSLNKYIDHTLLNPIATPNNIKALCLEAIEHNFYAVCINGSFVKQAKKELKNSNVKLAAVIGFPLGTMAKRTKLYEAKQCVADGADEIDMVINLGLFKSNNYNAVENEIKTIKKTINHKVLKVILETCYLTKDEIKTASKLAINAEADFIKTSTGFGVGGATIDDVKLMKQVAKNDIKIKASGGIRDYETALNFIELGVERIGTSSGIKIVS